MNFLTIYIITKGQIQQLQTKANPSDLHILGNGKMALQKIIGDFVTDQSNHLSKGCKSNLFN